MASTTSASHLASLHKPGTPLVIANIWDLSSLHTVLSLPASSPPIRAVATASYAIAASLGLADEDLSLGANLIRTAQLAPRVRAAGLPLSVDVQDGYGARLEDAVAGIVRAGAVGANLEDLRADDTLWSLEEQVQRIRRAVVVAERCGCAGFVVNARCDVLNHAFRTASSSGDGKDEELLDEVVRRGKAYLDAGATTVFVWGGARGLRDAEVRVLVREFGGRLAVKLATGPEALSVSELADMGVARISVGPGLYRAGCQATREAAERIVGGGRL